MGSPRVVLLGLMSKMPFGGNVWLVLQYMHGLARLGFEPHYVEAHGAPPVKFITDDDPEGVQGAARFIADVMDRFGFGDRWAYDTVYGEERRFFGMERAALNALYASSAVIINLHGGTELLDEHMRAGARIYLGTDPVDVEVHIHNGVRKYVDLLAPHDAFFTWGTNYGAPDCGVPLCERFALQPTVPVVAPEFWEADPGPGITFTTVGNWKQSRRADLEYRGEIYGWSKHLEFLKFIDLPRRTKQPLELALSGTSIDDDDRRMLADHGWGVRDALTFSADLDGYRNYLQGSRGEFTVAKDQNIRLRSGWFSERSAQYLASGRPVVTQETGFSNHIPTGEGLFGFSTLDEILDALEGINGDYPRHREGARRLAKEVFSYDVVLPPMLRSVGL